MLLTIEKIRFKKKFKNVYLKIFNMYVQIFYMYTKLFNAYENNIH